MPKQMKLYQEEAKTRHTSHWDWDYMTTAEFNTLMREQQQHRERTEAHSRRRQRLIQVGAGLLVVALISALSFLQV